jgi:hypothetical protein
METDDFFDCKLFAASFLDKMTKGHQDIIL